MTPSEKFVSELCEKSFLPFWSFLSPIGKKVDKELCDVLVVCQNTIIIISVKDIKLTNHNDENVQYQRWQREAVEGSVSQIYGAERFLKKVNEVTLNDRTTKIALPDLSEREVFRIAIAFGSEERFPLDSRDFGNGFVHVFDEQSTFTVLKELDTITDFVNYLRAKEKFLADKIVSVSREVDFLALYLRTELKFEQAANMIVLDEGMWEDYVESEEYKDWQIEVQQSYIWDEIVSHLHKIHIVDKSSTSMMSDLERATRLITLEPRINRIELGMTFLDAMKKKVKARMIKPLKGSDHSYVFMPLSEKNWQNKEKELQLRCLIARNENPEATKVIGISMGKSPEGDYIFDIMHFNLPTLSKEIAEKIEEAKQVLGYFKKPTITQSKDLR